MAVPWPLAFRAHVQAASLLHGLTLQWLPLQIMGFGWMFVLFLLCAWQYKRLTQPAHLWIFRALYYLSRSNCLLKHFAT